MQDDPSDPAPEQADSARSPEDDWADAVESQDGGWGESDLPVLRSPADRSVVTVIESAPRPGERPGDESSDGREGSRGGVQVREISGRKPRRLKPEKPDPQNKVPRKESPMERAKPERFDVEEKEWSAPTTIFRTKWIVALSVAIPALIVFCLIQLPQLNPARKKEAGVTAAKPEIPDFFQIDDKDIEDLLERQDEAKQLFEDYVTADSVDTVLGMVRDRAGVEQLIRDAGHQPMAGKSWRLNDRGVWSLHMQHRTPYARLRGELPNYDEFTCYLVVEGDRLVIDWKASTGYSSSPFEQLKQGLGDGSEVRGVATPSNLYTKSFPEREYQCYRVESPDGQEVLWCYARLESSTAGVLARMFVGGQISDRVPGPVQVTLGLTRGSGDSLPNQWLIEQFHHEQWISP